MVLKSAVTTSPATNSSPIVGVPAAVAVVNPSYTLEFAVKPETVKAFGVTAYWIPLKT